LSPLPAVPCGLSGVAFAFSLVAYQVSGLQCTEVVFVL
jgi:hypothetical protein